MTQNKMGFSQFLKEVFGFSIAKIVRKNHIKTNLVLHVGANFGQEADVYDELGFKKVVWIEGFPEFFAALKENVDSRKNHQVVQAMISDVDDEEVEFIITSNSGSSTTLPLTESWSSTFTDVQPIETVKIRCTRLDNVFSNELCAYKTKPIDLMVMDIEGAELKALNSMGDIIKNVQFALIEVSFRNNFVGGPLLIDIDRFMLKHNFKRVYMKAGPASGDALYSRQSMVSFLERRIMNLTALFIQFLSKYKVTDVVTAAKGVVKNVVRY